MLTRALGGIVASCRVWQHAYLAAQVDCLSDHASQRGVIVQGAESEFPAETSVGRPPLAGLGRANGGLVADRARSFLGDYG